MGFIDTLLGRTKQDVKKLDEANKTFELVTAYKPVFTTWQGKIYESELVRAAIDARARHISKISVSFIGSGAETFTNKLKKRPNKFSTWSGFLYRVSTMLDVANNVIIVPIYDEDLNRVGIWPLFPKEVRTVEYKGELWLKYDFERQGIRAACRMSDCMILNRFQCHSDFWGEDNKALDPTMDVIHLQKQGIKEAIKNSSFYRFIAQADNFSLKEDLEKNQVNFSERNFGKNSRGGAVLLFPHEYKNLQQIKVDNYNIDTAQADYIRENVFNYFAVSKEIIQNKATGEILMSFYEGVIEPWSIRFSEEFTFFVYSEREIANGSKVFAGTNRIQYMSMSDKKSILEVAGDRGLLTINEGREILNLAPLPDEQGNVAFIRGEYYPVSQKIEETTEGGQENDS